MGRPEEENTGARGEAMRREAKERRSSERREGEGASPCHGGPLARARSESEARSGLRRGASRSLKAKQDSEAREARRGGGIHHAEIVRVPVDALQESLSLEACLFAKQERARELLLFADQDGHGKREAGSYGIESARGASFAISSKGGRGMDAGLSHGEEASTAEKRSLRIIVRGGEGERAESLGDGTEAGLDRALKEKGEELGLFGGDASREPELMPWELLRPVEPIGEGEAEAPSLAIGEAESP
jgi:hypothetical protein